MNVHILNGDSLISRFRQTGLDGAMIVAREALVDGEVSGGSLDEFWETRARFLSGTSQASREEYFAHSKPEFEKIIRAPNGTAFHLWFGYDLFCQVNMWFVLYLIAETGNAGPVYVVYPFYLKERDRWDDFGSATVADLQQCYQQRRELGPDDRQLGRELWLAYQKQDLEKLLDLAQKQNPCFPYLKEVCEAEADRHRYVDGRNRPEKTILDIVDNKGPAFKNVFPEFMRREGVYGFGDLQVKRIYDALQSGR